MSAVFEAVGDVVSSVGDAVGDVADVVVSTASDVLETVAENPLLVIAAIAAPELLPALGEATAGAEFGSEFVFDIADQAVFGDLAGEVAGAQLAADPSYVNPSYSGSAPVSVIDNFVQNLPQTAVENLAKSAAGNVVRSAVTGQDIDLGNIITGAALMTAGGGITASLRDMGIPTSVAPILTSAGVSAVTGGDPVMAALNTGINQGWQKVGADGIRALKDYIKPENYETIKTMAEAEGVDMSAPPQVAQAEPTTPTTPETPAVSPLAQAETTTPTTPETPAVSPLQQVASAETKTDVPVEELKYGEEGYVYPDGTVQGPTGTIEIPQPVDISDAGLSSPLSPEVTPTQQDVINASNQIEAQQMGPSLPTGGVVDTSDAGLASPLSPQVTPTQQDIIDASKQATPPLQEAGALPTAPTTTPTISTPVNDYFYQNDPVTGGVPQITSGGISGSPVNEFYGDQTYPNGSSFVNDYYPVTQVTDSPVESPLSPPTFELDPNSYLTPQQQEDVAHLVNNVGVPVQEAIDLVVNDAITVTPEPVTPVELPSLSGIEDPNYTLSPPYTPNVTDSIQDIASLPYQTNVTDPLEGVVTPQMPPAVTPSLPSISIPTNPTGALPSLSGGAGSNPLLSMLIGSDPTAAQRTTGALPGSLKETALAAAPINQQIPNLILQLKQLYPQLSGIDDSLLHTIASRNNAQNELMTMAKGGKIDHVPEFITGKTGNYVRGRGDGQSDEIPAMLADGEYVFDADTVAALGNGSNEAGAKVLDKMRESIRKHKRSAPINKIPPKAKSPLEYLKG